MNEHFHVVKYLIEQGEADPNIAPWDGENALHYAAQNTKKYYEHIQFLIEQEQGKDDLQICHQYLLIDVFIDAIKRNTEFIELLLTHMSLNSINKKDRWGYTPLDDNYHYYNNWTTTAELITVPQTE